MHGLKVVNTTEFLILILKVVRLIVTIVSISIIFFITIIAIIIIDHIIQFFLKLCKYFRIYSLKM